MREYCSVITSCRNSSSEASAAIATMLGRGVITSRTIFAKLDHRLDEFSVVLLDEPFLGSGADERLDILGGGGRLFAGRLIVGEFDQRLEEFEERFTGARDPRQHAQQGRER